MGTIKIKNTEFLINAIREKLNGTEVPKYTWLIGAGCSMKSGIPNGGQVIELLQMEIFRREHITEAVPFEVVPPFSFGEYQKQFADYLAAQGLEDHYRSFTEEHTARIHEEVDAFNEANIELLIPPHRRSADADAALRREQNTAFFAGLKSRIYADYEYGYFFRQYSESASERQALVEKIIEDKQTKYGYVCLANLIRYNFVRTVFTTNFDDLLNEALMAYFSRHAKVLAHSELSGFVDYRGKTPHIIKLHGDFLFNDIRNTGDEINLISNKLTEKLSEALRDGFGLVVLGYNGADYSIVNKLEETKKLCGSSPYPLIWCDRKGSEKLHWRVQDLLASTPNSFYIHIDSFDTLMARLETSLHVERVNLIERSKIQQAELDKFYADVVAELEPDTELKDKMEKIRDASVIFQEAYEEQDHVKAIGLYGQALKLNPDSYETVYNLGWRHLRLGQIHSNQEEILTSVGFFKKALEMRPRSDYSLINLGLANSELYRMGVPGITLEETFEKYLAATEIDPKNATAWDNWSSALIVASRTMQGPEREVYLRLAIEKGEKAVEYGGSPYNMACAHALLHEKERAMALLEATLFRKFEKADYVRTDPDWSAYRDDPQFLSVLGKYAATA